jgi:MraZ protein
MFIGEYQHTIDAKKRFAIPSRMRKELGDVAVVTRGMDSCLFVYPAAAWQKLVEKLAGMSVGKSDTRSFVRLMLAGAQEVEIDAMGRALIPDHLKEYAGLRKKIIVAGVFDRLEVWDEEKWMHYKQTAERSNDAIAEKLGELGVF